MTTKTFTQNVLVPTDFSKASKLALEAAHQIAAQNDAKLTLVHIYDPRGVLFGGEPGLEYGHGIPKDEEEKIHGAMRELVEQRLGDLAKVKTALVVSESPAKGIVDYAEKEGVDLIVISTHGRTGLRRMMIGSVAERVVRHAHCPVLTLRSKLQD